MGQTVRWQGRDEGWLRSAEGAGCDRWHGRKVQALSPDTPEVSGKGIPSGTLGSCLWPQAEECQRGQRGQRGLRVWEWSDGLCEGGVALGCCMRGREGAPQIPAAPAPPQNKGSEAGPPPTLSPYLRCAPTSSRSPERWVHCFSEVLLGPRWPVGTWGLIGARTAVPRGREH